MGESQVVRRRRPAAQDLLAHHSVSGSVRARPSCGEELDDGSRGGGAERSGPAVLVEVEVGLFLEERAGLAVDGDRGVRVHGEVPRRPVDLEGHLRNANSGLLGGRRGAVVLMVVDGDGLHGGSGVAAARGDGGAICTVGIPAHSRD